MSTVKALRRAFGIVDGRVKLDGQPAVIPGRANRLDDRDEVDRTGAGDHVMMNTGRGDVFQVIMLRVFRHLLDLSRQVLAHAIGVADVEVETERRRVYPVVNFEKLIGRLDQQARFRLDQEQDSKSFSMFRERLQDFDEKVDRLAPRLSGRERSARFGRDVRRVHLGAKFERAVGMVDPGAAISFVGFDERRIPIGLAMIGDRVHHEGVDV